MTIKTRKEILELMRLEKLVLSEYDPVTNKLVKVKPEVAASNGDYLSNDIMIYLRASPVFQTMKYPTINRRLEDDIEHEENDIVNLSHYFLDDVLKGRMKESIAEMVTHKDQLWKLDEDRRNMRVYKLDREGELDVFCWVGDCNEPEFKVKINPGSLVLTYSNEYLKYPHDHMGRIYSRSSHGRKFRFDCTDGSAQVNKPGSDNAIVLELTTTHPVHVGYGDKIGYITVEQIESPVSGGYKGKAKGQGPHEGFIRTYSYKSEGK